MKEKLLILLLFLSFIGKSQSDCDILLSKKYLKSYVNSALTIVEQPKYYDWKDWSAVAGLAAVTTLTFVYDEEIYLNMSSFADNYNLSEFSDYVGIMGDELFILPSIAVMYAVSALNKDCHLRNLSLAALQSFVFAEVASAGIKIMTCRERPQTAETLEIDSNKWGGPFSNFESSSFVSGHSMRAFALATTISGFYSEQPWVGILSYSLATITSFSRLVAEEHWASDVVVGAALGYFIGRGVTAFNKDIGNIQMTATDYGIGLSIKF